AEAGAEVTGIDLSPVAIDVAREHCSQSGLNIDYRVSDITGLKDKGEFDVILCSEVLEHVDDLNEFLREALLKLKSGGIFLFSTINNTLKAKFLTIFMAEDILRLLPQGTHSGDRFIKPSDLVSILSDNDVEVEEVKGMKLNPIKLNFSITKDTSVNYIGYGVKRS
ncbi:MAG: 3-demethylubiquinone-9 3-O-methyltransferase, partial [Deltaproteobacteria bacterium]|nr:3-demethylubiquinone-9 3-O-methyltransferase [Deltaproteobacteria bacterium]